MVSSCSFVPYGPLCENITSSPKLKSATYCTVEQRRTEPQLTCTENSRSLDEWFLRYASGQTNRYAHRHADHANCTKPTHHVWFWPIPSITWKHDVIHKTGSIAWPSELQPQVTCTKNLVKFGLWFLRQASRQTKKPTNRHIDYNTSHKLRQSNKTLK